MNKLSKQEIINQIEEWFSKCTIAIITDYRGLSVASTAALRRKLRESSTEYRVTKNTLTRFAVDKVGKEEVKEFIQGPTAIAFGYGEITEAVKALTDHIQASKLPITIKGGIMGSRLLKPDEITFLATVPPREVLLVRLLGMMQSPITSLLFTLNANLRNLVQVIEARRQQLESA